MDEPRYTASEWAIIEGGHELEISKPKYSFIQGLYEEGLVEKKKSDKEDKKDKKDKEESETNNYRFLLSIDKLPFAKKFVTNARQSKTIISNFVEAYRPIIIMVDDIVKAGPAYIEQLKQVHNRAKRSLKK